MYISYKYIYLHTYTHMSCMCVDIVHLREHVCMHKRNIRICVCMCNLVHWYTHQLTLMTSPCLQLSPVFLPSHGNIALETSGQTEASNDSISTWSGAEGETQHVTTCAGKIAQSLLM